MHGVNDWVRRWGHGVHHPTMRGSTRFVLSFLGVVGVMALWNVHGEEPLRLRLGADGGPVACGPASASTWSSSAPCFPGTIRIVRDACKATIRMPNGDLHEEAFPTRPDYLLFPTSEHGWCHLDLQNQRLECDYRCDDDMERCDHACKGTVLPALSSPRLEARLMRSPG
jgi:hypothetical protein